MRIRRMYGLPLRLSGSTVMICSQLIGGKDAVRVSWHEQKH